MKSTQSRSSRWLASIASAAFLLIVSFASSPAAAQQAGTLEQWYVVQMQGQRAGWMHFRESVEGDAIRTESRVHLEIARGALNVSIDLESDFLETLDGRPITMISRQTLGRNPITRTYTFKEDRIVADVQQGLQQDLSTLPPAEEDWMPPAAARRFVQRMIEENRETFSYKLLEPTTGPSPVRVETKVVGPTTVQALGKVVPAIELITRQSTSPGVETIEYVDESGAPIKSEVDMGAITLTMLASEREVALAKIEPVEMMVSTLVRPSRPIANPRSVSTARYTLSIDDDRFPDVPETGAQRVERIDETSVRVVVTSSDPSPAPREDVDDPRYLAATPMANWRDERIGALTERALTGAEGASIADRAETLRRFVHHYIDEKNLDVGLASATEVARTREGDCTEHATLLTAMLRADGIPARAASGLIYADQFAGRSRIFGYHMWTQALLPGPDGDHRWVDLDPTLHDDTPFDATHITLGVSSLADDEMINSMAVLAPLMGKLRIEVEAAE